MAWRRNNFDSHRVFRNIFLLKYIENLLGIASDDEMPNNNIYTLLLSLYIYTYIRPTDGGQPPFIMISE